MKVNLDQTLVDFEGDPIAVTKQRIMGNMIAEVPETKKTKGEDGVEKEEPIHWSLKRICVNTLSTPHENDKNMDADALVKRWKLAMRLHDGGEQEMSADEAVELRKRMALFNTHFGLQVVAQACEMLKG